MNMNCAEVIVADNQIFYLCFVYAQLVAIK